MINRERPALIIIWKFQKVKRENQHRKYSGELMILKTRTRSKHDVAKLEGATGGREGEQKYLSQRESTS